MWTAHSSYRYRSNTRHAHALTADARSGRLKTSQRSRFVLHKSTTPKLTRAGLLLLASLGLAAFDTGAHAQGTSTDVGLLNLGWVKSTANLMSAVAPRLAEKYGLKIQSINFNTAQDILTALIAGQLDVGLLTPVHLLRAIDTKIDVMQVAGNTRGNTGIVASKALGLKEGDWAQLKSVAKSKRPKVASSRGSINEMLALASFTMHGFDPNKDLDIVNIANFAQHPQALRSGEFDMIVTLEPLAALSVVESTGTLFHRPYDTPAADLNTNYVVTKTVIANNPERVRAFVATLADASRYLSDKEQELDSAVKLTGLKPEVLRLALSNNRYELRNGVQQMQELAKLAAQLRVTTQDVSAQLPAAVTDRFLTEAGVMP
jgi:ABC-type nitrate/sulfonate/bicarbonate transport system substrate-binding protein